ncbi:hypothetical protein NL676_021923 [Syzygium grande]|nr:hypothetical protein NL676_021923 [Syzygium grande]
MFSGVMNLFGFEDVILDCVIIGWLRVAAGGGGGNAGCGGGSEDEEGGSGGVGFMVKGSVVGELSGG